MATTTGATGAGFTGAIYHRSYPALRVLTPVWRAIAVAASLYAWCLTLPWLFCKWIAPANLMGFMKDTEENFFTSCTPAINFFQDTAYKAIDFADYALYRGVLGAEHVYQHQLKDFLNAFQSILNHLETRTSLLQDHGLNGIRLALSPNSGASAPSVTGSFTPSPMSSVTAKKAMAM